MSTITTSGATAISSIFNVVSTTANTIDRSVSTIDDLTRAMQAKSRAWAEKSIHATTLRSRADIALTTMEIQQEVASKLKDYQKFQEDPANAEALEKAKAFLTAPTAA